MRNSEQCDAEVTIAGYSSVPVTLTCDSNIELNKKGRRIPHLHVNRAGWWQMIPDSDDINFRYRRTGRWKTYQKVTS